VYKLDPDAKTLALFVQSPSLRYPNGLAFGTKHLYIATYQNGLVRLDTASRQIEKLGGVSDTTISHGLDGLVYIDNSLIGVYNLGKEQAENCIVQYHLSKDGTRVQKEQVIVKAHPVMADPTTAVLFKHSLYVLANSYLDVFNKNNMSTKGIEARLHSPAILVVDIQK
jgi:hypothetical protein